MENNSNLVLISHLG